MNYPTLRLPGNRVLAGIVMILLTSAPLVVNADAEASIIDAARIAEQLDTTTLDFDQLHTYDELVEELYTIESGSNGRIDVGPLIKNGSNGGLIDIDVAYSTGVNLRDAVVNTVALDSVPFMGNSDPAKVGLSNKGRAIMAARFGHGPQKIMYITQQHGNEFIETEAAFNFLGLIARGNDSFVKKLANKITLLMIVRANPDGGEPNPDACQMGVPFPPPQNPNYDCAFYRFNIDNTAGGFPTADSFRGAVGVGYNLNRYHIPTLESPIRPVEAQAMVASVLAFQPNYIMDLHGDLPKVTCAIEQASIAPVVPGLLYDANCESEMGARLNELSVRDMAEFLNAHDEKAQRWNGMITNLLRLFGVQAGRHRQFNESAEIHHTAGDYSLLQVNGEPIHTMLLEMRNLFPLADPVVVGLDFSQTPPAPQVDFALNTPLGDYNFEITKALSEFIMMQGLIAIASNAVDYSNGDAGYQFIPKDTGFIYQASPLTMQLLGLQDDGPYLFPLCTFENCLGD